MAKDLTNQILGLSILFQQLLSEGGRQHYFASKKFFKQISQYFSFKKKYKRFTYYIKLIEDRKKT